MSETQMKPYGWLYTQGQKYLLLNPQPLPKDSQWNDGTYTFFVVANRYTAKEDRFVSMATHVVTNSFAIEYDSKMSSIMVKGILNIPDGVTSEDVITPFEAAELVDEDDDDNLDPNYLKKGDEI